MLLLSLLIRVCSFAEVVRSGVEMPDIPTRALGGNLFEVILPKVQTLVKHVNHLVPAVEGFPSTGVREYFVNGVLRSDNELVINRSQGAAFGFKYAGVVIGPNLQLLLQAFVIFADVIHDDSLLASVAVPPFVTQLGIEEGVPRAGKYRLTDSRGSINPDPFGLV